MRAPATPAQFTHTPRIAPATYDVIIRIAPDMRSKPSVADAIARRYKLDRTTTARLAAGMPVLMARHLPQQGARRLGNELVAMRANVHIRTRDRASVHEGDADRPGHSTLAKRAPSAATMSHQTPPATVSRTARQRNDVGSASLAATASRNYVALLLAQSVYYAQVAAVGAGFFWHLIAHRRWVIADLPWPFASVYIMVAVGAAALLGLLLKTAIAPSARLTTLRFGQLTRVPFLSIPLRQMTQSLDDTEPETLRLFKLNGELVFRPTRTATMTCHVPLKPSTPALDAANAITKQCQASVQDYAPKLLLAADLSLFRLWYKGHIADAWDVAVDERIGSSRDLEAGAWLVLRGLLNIGKLPALVSLRIARFLMAPNAYWRFCRTTPNV